MEIKEIKENKKELLPSERSREELELAVAEYEKKYPNTFTFGILEEEDDRYFWKTGKYYYIPYVVIHKVHDCEEVEIPDFVREFKFSHLSYRRGNGGNRYIFPENLKKIKGGQGLRSISHMFENTNFIHTVDVSQLCVKNIRSMFATFSHCKAKGLKGLSAWSFGGRVKTGSMFFCAEIEVLEDMFLLSHFVSLSIGNKSEESNESEKSNSMFWNAKIAKILDLSSWETATNLNEGLIKNEYINAIIPDLGLDKNEKKKADTAKVFCETSAFLQKKGEYPLETAIEHCYVLEHMPEGKTASTIEEWFEVYLQDPWEMKFVTEVFRDLVEVYHKNNPEIFKFVRDEEGHIRIRDFFLDNWEKSEFYQTRTIVIPDFVYGFEGSPFKDHRVKLVREYIYDGILIFRLGKNVRDLSYMFSDYNIAQQLMLEDWDTSKVTKMDSMFERAVFYQIWGLEKFDTSKVTSMSFMFALGKFDESDFMRSKYERFARFGSFKEMFNGVEGIEGWDTSSVVDMSSMFRYATMEALNLNGWDVSNVTDVAFMFFDNYALKELLIDEWKPKNVKNLKSTFTFCYHLEHLNLRDWDLRNVEAMNSVFEGCESLETLDVSGWQLPTEGRVDSRKMFEDCRSLKTLDLSSWNFSCFTCMDSCFEDCVNLSISNGDEVMAKWDISNVETMKDIFLNCGITLKNPKKVREIWMSKHPSCEVASKFHDMIYGVKPLVKEMEINDFMPDLGLHYEICKWDEDADGKRRRKKSR